MYGRQSEIQRIQSKLQRIGQSNPHRVSAFEPETSHNAQEHKPTNTKTNIALPDAVTFLPQHPWPDQIYPVPHDVRENIHQLAETLRQPSSPNYPADSHYNTHQTMAHPRHGPWQAGHPEDHHSHHDGADSFGHQVLSPFQSTPRFTLPQGIMWLAGAIVVRVGIDRLLIHFPNLWIVMAAIVLTPVAIALYQTAMNPQSTVHSGRRLLVIMMGLLIGGQL